jgi:hypothetical protein
MFSGIDFEPESGSIEKFKQRVPKMSDEELIREGRMLRDLWGLQRSKYRT